MPSRSQAPGDSRSDRKPRLLDDDTEPGRPGQLVADRAHATAGGVAHPAGAGRRRGAAPATRPLSGRGVGADVRVDGQVAARQQHRHPVVADRPGAAAPGRSGRTRCAPSSRPAGTTPSPAVVTNSPSAAPRGHHLGVAGDDLDPGPCRGLGHVGDDVAQDVDGQALLDDEARGQPARTGARDRQIVDRAVDGQVADRPTGEAERAAPRRSRCVNASRSPEGRVTSRPVVRRLQARGCRKPRGTRRR